VAIATCAGDMAFGSVMMFTRAGRPDAGVGHVTGGLLVPRADDANVLVVAALEDGVDVPSV
jgi:hypothetical protein